jgi:hypothetical protein
MDEDEIICWHYDHKHGQNVKRVNLLTAFYSAEMIGRQKRNEVKFSFILADPWYASAENMRFIDKKRGLYLN